MASGVIGKPANIVIRTARFTPTLLSGGSGFTCDSQECYYYRYGPFVLVNYLFWNFNITNSNSSIFTLSLPFNCYSARNYGLVGYDNKNVLGNTVCASNDSLAFGFFQKNSYSTLAGNQVTANITFQCSIIYVTNDP